MGWMGKRGVLTSLLWKVKHLGLLYADSVLLFQAYRTSPQSQQLVAAHV